ncbi:MAG: orotidine-5'-phosphate decarboxylase [Bacteroidales bacterium]|jgi:orotidine-5'-phosphate decarboxylase
MKKLELFNQIKNKKSFLCVGLDSDYTKLPECLLNLEDPIFEFNKNIIDATHEFTIAYKPNIAFYESVGSKGWTSLEKTINYIKKVDKNLFVIADAKRGDIGNTSKQYAKAFFEKLNADAITIAPYMGKDSVTPFMNFENKWVILLALTSNEGAIDFQLTKVNNEELYKRVIKQSTTWGGNADNMMYVVGATKAEALKEIRKIIPDNFLLIPGVGAQGGSLEEVCKYGLNNQVGLIVNSSRGIIFASNGKDYADAAKQKAFDLQQKMEKIISNL